MARFAVSVVVLILLKSTESWLLGRTTAHRAGISTRLLVPLFQNMPTTCPSSYTGTTTTILSSSPFSSMDTELMLPPNDVTPFLAPVALCLVFAAQSFINQMLEGDQGLAAFLKDGSGYNKSSFRSMQQQKQRLRRSSSKDPLPWLKLPQLDFVDVVGQEKTALRTKPMKIVEQVQGSGTDELFEELEQLRLNINRELQEENLQEAERIQSQVEKLMRENGIEYKTTA
jgi:hypothetical protein